MLTEYLLATDAKSRRQQVRTQKELLHRYDRLGEACRSAYSGRRCRDRYRSRRRTGSVTHACRPCAGRNHRISREASSRTTVAERDGDVGYGIAVGVDDFHNQRLGQNGQICRRLVVSGNYAYGGWWAWCHGLAEVHRIQARRGTVNRNAPGVRGGLIVAVDGARVVGNRRDGRESST